MREILIDLSDDFRSPNIFGGYIGEHNETKIIVKLPQRLLSADITQYQFAFKNKDNLIDTNNAVDISQINEGFISTFLDEDKTIGQNLIFNINAIVEVDNEIVRKAKTPIVSLKIRRSI